MNEYKFHAAVMIGLFPLSQRTNLGQSLDNLAQPPLQAQKYFGF
jgi:hypothetical protein